MRRVRRIALLAVALLAATPAAAHPHVWISVRCVFLFDAEGRATGLEESWSFDEMYSSFAVTGLHRDKAGKHRREDLAGLAKTVVSASGDQAHFTTATRGGEALRFRGATGEAAEFGADGRLVVRFRLDFEEPQKTTGEPLRIEVHDPELYADFQFAERTPDEAKSLPAGCAVAIDDPKSHLPKDPEAIERALIDGPLVPLASGLVLSCG